jgi:AsmA protein
LPNGSKLQGGTAGVKATIKGPVDRLVIAGSLNMRDTKLVGFNLSSKLSGVEKLAGIKAGPDTEIQQLSGNVKVAPDGIMTDTLKLIVPAIGDLSGSGTVNPDSTLNFKMVAEMHTSGVAAGLNNQPVPFTVGGTCADPVFHPDMKAVMKGEVKGVVKDLFGGKK